MKIALVTEELAQGQGCGGIGGAFHELALLLARTGHTVDVLYAPTSPRQAAVEELARIYAAHGVVVQPLPVADHIWNTGSPEGRAYATFAHLRAQAVPYDVIHFHDYKGLGHYCVAAKKQGLAFPATTLVVQVHGPTRWTLEANGHDFSHEDQLRIDFLERGSIAGCDQLVSPSRYMLDWLNRHAWTTPPAGQVHVIQNPCSRLLDSRLVPPAARPAARPTALSTALPAGLPAAPATPRRLDEIVLFARHEERKGITQFCDALDLLAEDLADAGIRVTFLGPLGAINGEPSLTYLANRARHWRFAINVLPDYGRQDAAAHLAGNPRSLVVVPSPFENSPYAVLEAVALGKPLLTSSEGGAPELLDAATARRMTCRITGPDLAAALRRMMARGLAIPRPAIPCDETERLWVALHTRLTPRPVVRAPPHLVAPPARDADPQRRRAQPRVTVAITHFERPAKLFDAVLSLARQTYTELEIVVVDDGSASPGTQDALRQMQPLFDRLGVRLLRQPNRYLGAARNHAARESQSDYLLFLDDDDLAFPTLVATLVQAAEATGADAMGCLNLFMEEHRRGEAHPFPDRFMQKVSYVPLGGPLSLAPLANVFASATALIRRSLFQRLDGYTELHGVGHEDYEFYVRAVQAGARLEICPVPLYLYEVGRPSMVTGTSQQKNFRRVARAIDTAACPAAWADLASLNAGRRAAEHVENLQLYRRQTSPHAALLNDLAGLPPDGVTYALRASDIAAALQAESFASALLTLARRREAARTDTTAPAPRPAAVELAFRPQAHPQAALVHDAHILAALIDLELGRVPEAVRAFRLSVERERRLTPEQRRFLVALAAAPTCPPAELEPVVDTLQRLTLRASLDRDLAPTLFRILLRAGAAEPTLAIVDGMLRHDHAAYVAEQPDVQASTGGSLALALAHYVAHGVLEGRRGFRGSALLCAVLQEELGVEAPLAGLRDAVAALGGTGASPVPASGAGSIQAVASPGTPPLTIAAAPAP